MDNEEFEAFWQRFPRRVAKLYALKCFIRARRIASFEDIMDGVARYAKEVGDKDAQYIAHPSSWLNGGRWMDDEGANRSAPVVNPSAQKTFAVRDTDHESKIWRWRLKCLKDSSLWLTSWGPKPGEPHCEVPRHLMEAA